MEQPTLLSQEQRDEAIERIEKVKKFMEENEVDIMGYPQKAFAGLTPDGVPFYADTVVTKLMDTKYMPKQSSFTPSPYGNGDPIQ